jgi:predicted nucleotidyltransferase
MPRSQAKKIVQKYARTLKAAGYSFHAIYLFGSQIMGKAKAWSDIDVAVVSDKLKKNEDKNRFLLWHMRREVDTRIEPHGFTVKDFQDNSDPLVYEIKRTGIKIA